MLVVHLHTLRAVHTLRLFNEIALDRFDTADAEDVVRVAGTVGQLCSGFDLLAFGDEDVGIALRHVFAFGGFVPDDAYRVVIDAFNFAGDLRNQVFGNCESAVFAHRIASTSRGQRHEVGTGIDPIADFHRGAVTVRDFDVFVIGLHVFNSDDEVALRVTEADSARDLRENRGCFGVARFKQFLNAGQTGRDVAVARDATGVEVTHRELGSRFSDRLCGDDTDGFADDGWSVVCKHASVASCADTSLQHARNRRSYFQLLESRTGYAACQFVVDEVVWCGDDFARFRFYDVADGITAEDAFFKRQVECARSFGGYSHSDGRATVAFVDDDVLRGVSHTAGEVSGFSGLERGVGQGLA